MVDSLYSGRAPLRNPDAPYTSPLQDDAELPKRPTGGLTALHPNLIDDPLVSPDDQIALLRAVEDEVIITIDDLARAIPVHPRPIGAILALVDAGILEIDRRAAFDGSVQLWRTSPACD